MNMILRNCHWAILMGITLIVTGIPDVGAAPKALYGIDFGQEETGDASAWLESQGFKTLLDADQLQVAFKDGALNISTNESVAGVFALKFGKQDYLPEVKHVVVEWGVNRFPTGADWEQGNNRVPIAIMFSFGDKKLSSGLPFGVNPAPYFLSPFIGEKEQVDKMYVGTLYEEGGRYFCVSNGGPPVGETIATKFEVANRFKETFKQDSTPPVTGFAFQMNTDDTDGGAEAFIRKIVFYSN